MKKNLSIFASLVCGSMLILTACGDGMHKKSYPIHEILGEFPALIAQYADADSILTAEDMAFESDDTDAVSKFSEKLEKKRKAARKELEDGVERVKSSLIGKDFPATSEVPEYEVTEMKIKNIDKSVWFEGKVKFVKPVKLSSYGSSVFYYKFILRDAQGNDISGAGMDQSTYPDYKTPEEIVGKEASVRVNIDPKKRKDWLRCAKIVFIPMK